MNILTESGLTVISSQLESQQLLSSVVFLLMPLKSDIFLFNVIVSYKVLNTAR